jgi:hypothetical protein
MIAMRQLRHAIPSAVLVAMLALPPVAHSRSVGNPDCSKRQYGINLVLEAAKALKAAGFLKGEPSGELLRTGKPPPPMAGAITAYRRSKGLAGSGGIDLELLRSLFGDRYPLEKAEMLGAICDDLARQDADPTSEP